MQRPVMATHLRLMRSNRSAIFPLAVDLELSCCATCGRVSFVRFIHVDGTYIAGQNSCAIGRSETPVTIASPDGLLLTIPGVMELVELAPSAECAASMIS